MLSCLKFILKFVADLCSMLFNIMVDNNLSFGLLLCIIFIFLPIVHRVICFIKQDAIEELDDKYDQERPRHIESSTLYENTYLGNGKRYSYVNTIRKNRRYRGR